MMRFLVLLLALGCASQAAAQVQWSDVNRDLLQDDDLTRHAADTAYLDGLSLSETRFSESGFDWHLIRVVNKAKPVGPLWVVPHDDENAAFDAAMAALKSYGGIVVAVNSGPDSNRFQYGNGACGGRAALVQRCDPNRNFSAATPLFTAAIVGQLPEGEPIIALHTNSPGYGRGQGDITIIDTEAAAKGIKRARKDGFFGKMQPASLDNPDTYAIIPYRGGISESHRKCREEMVMKGVSVWHERVGKSDGSLSNHVALTMPGIHYVNMESRREVDLVLAAERHGLMISAYVEGCKR
jgi:hypothetical protein